MSVIVRSIIVTLLCSLAPISASAAMITLTGATPYEALDRGVLSDELRWVVYDELVDVRETTFAHFHNYGNGIVEMFSTDSNRVSIAPVDPNVRLVSATIGARGPFGAPGGVPFYVNNALFNPATDSVVSLVG